VKTQSIDSVFTGRYNARLFLHGKEFWKLLKSSHFSVAEARLAALQKFATTAVAGKA
jgi:hypothetical protein